MNKRAYGSLLVKLLWVVGVVCATQANATPYLEYGTLTSCQLHSIDENDTHLFDCQSPSPKYDVLLMSNDLRTSLMLKHDALELMYSPSAPHYVGDVLEWRYRIHNGKKHHHALIYRLYVNETLHQHRYRSYLVVIRLQGDASCYLGVISPKSSMNDTARTLADDPNATCQAPDELGAHWW